MTTIQSPATHTAVDLAPGRWAIDPGHAEVTFIGRHFGLTKVRGRFTGIDGTVDVGPTIQESTIHVNIDMTTVESGSSDRDAHLRSGDLFDVETHPTATFRSSSIAATGSSGAIAGDLTIKGITRSVILDAEFVGSTIDTSDNERAVFTASTVVNRYDFDVTWNMALEAGGLLVSKEIRSRSTSNSFANETTLDGTSRQRIRARRGTRRRRR